MRESVEAERVVDCGGAGAVEGGGGRVGFEVGLQGERAGRMAWALSSRCREAVRDGDGAAATQLRGRMMRAAMHDDALGGTASGVEGRGGESTIEHTVSRRIALCRSKPA